MIPLEQQSLRDVVSVTLMVRDAGPILDEFLARVLKQEIDLHIDFVALYFGHRSESLNKLREADIRVFQINPSEFDYGISRDLVCAQALGEYVVTASVDALPNSNQWLKELIAPLRSDKADVVQGDIDCPEAENSNYLDFFYWENRGIFTYTKEGKHFFEKYGGQWLSCINLAFKKDVWRQTGFSGVAFCEDKIFQKRIYEAGFKIVFAKKAVVIHAHAYTTIESLFRRVANEGLGWRQVGEHYTFRAMLEDLLRFDLHWLAMNALINGKLKYASEILFFILRPIALFWGNNCRKVVYL